MNEPSFFFDVSLQVYLLPALYVLPLAKLLYLIRVKLICCEVYAYSDNYYYSIQTDYVMYLYFIVAN